MKINQALSGLLLPIEKLVPLDGNPRRGNVDAILASYKEFGQVKPIVVRPNEDGTYTIIAGNHQVQAAKALGWDSIAAVQMDEDDRTAIAFALADNRTSELGSIDAGDLMAAIQYVSEDYSNLVGDLGWDEFELAAIEETAYDPSLDDERGYVAPTIVEPLPVSVSSQSGVRDDPKDEKPLAKVDTGTAAVLGAAEASKGQKAVVQYTLVFETSGQQSRWYDFIRFLRSSAVYGGETTAARLLEFIEAHADF